MTHAKMTRDSFHVFQANARNALKQSEQVPSVLICAGTGCIAGGAMKIAEFVRFEKGEGMQKREDNFADEVASMMK